MLGWRELREHTKYGFSKNPQSPRNDTEKDLKTFHSPKEIFSKPFPHTNWENSSRWIERTGRPFKVIQRWRQLQESLRGDINIHTNFSYLSVKAFIKYIIWRFLTDILITYNTCYSLILYLVRKLLNLLRELYLLCYELGTRKKTVHPRAVERSDLALRWPTESSIVKKA